jgi:sulfate transport system permease protein
VFNLSSAWRWPLLAHRFPGRRLIDAAVDLPFALPTAVAGIALTALYAPNGAFGALAKEMGFKIAYTPLGIFIALVFVGLPFVTRTVQPVIDEIDREVEEASATLGANRLHTLRHVILPMLAPAALTGFALSLARAVGEYGSVIFIAGNLPMKTEIAPLLIVIKLEEFNYAGATAIGIAMLVISFLMLLLINAVQVWSRRRIGCLTHLQPGAPRPRKTPLVRRLLISGVLPSLHCFCSAPCHRLYEALRKGWWAVTFC